MYTAHVAELPMIGDDDEHEDEDLATRVSRAWCVHQWDPTVPLVKLGRFEGIRAIGSGSFGVVFKVRDPELDRDVALKLCKVVSDRDGERMLREARMLAKLSHPNVVAVHEVGLYDGEDEYEGSAFIVMELIEGTTGRRLIEARPSWWDAVDFYSDAARGLAAAHAAGVVHGDFKPSNVIRADRRTRVVDFGLGHSLEPEQAGRYKGRGTLPYMAPELLEGGVSSPLADQWALCVSLWETLERVRPFDGRSALSLLDNISAQRFNVSSSKSMPPRLRAALRKGLAFEPSERWADMEELVVELDAIRAGKGDDKRLPRPPGGIVVYFALATFAGVLGALAVRSTLDVEREVEPTEITKAPALSIKDLWFEYTEEHGDQLVSVEDALSFAGKMIEEAESEAESDPASSLAKARAAHAAASHAKLLLVSGGSSQMEKEWAESLIAESEKLSRSIQQSHPGW